MGLVSRSRALEARRARALKKGSYLALAPCQRGLKIERIATSSQAMMIVLELDSGHQHAKKFDGPPESRDWRADFSSSVMYKYGETLLARRVGAAPR